MRDLIATGKTVDEAIESACAQLGVSRDDENVESEVLELPVKKLFRSLPAKVKVTVKEEADNEIVAEAPAETPAAPQAPQEQAPAAPAREAREPKNREEEEEYLPVDIESDEKLKAAVDYLKTVMAAMGVEDVTFEAVKNGEATILRVAGKNVGVLIGHRGETMESLSYLASLVANRMGGDYLKLGLDVAGYRAKREKDLETLVGRYADRVKKSGHCYALEPMNPYERRIVHSAVGKIEGVRSESKGEGQNRRVVIYSTDPNASNTPERERRPRDGRPPRGGNRFGGSRGNGNGPRYGGGNRGNGSRYGEGNRAPHGDRGPRPPRSNVPEREFDNENRDVNATPVAPKRTERIDDSASFALYGKIEL